MIKLGSRIRQLRNTKGWSQQAVADHLNMSQVNYHKIESDKAQPRLEQLEKIAELFEISILDLIDQNKNTFHIQHNQHSQNGIVMMSGDVDLYNKQLQAKEEIIKLKEEKIQWLQKQIEEFKRKKN